MRQRLLKKHRHGIWQDRLFSFVLSFLILTTILFVLAITPNQAKAATSSTLNFQGRLLSSSGALVADGSYNIEFNLYDQESLGSSLWTEAHTGGIGNLITVQNGYFNVYLGDSTSGTPFPGAIDWDQELWITMNVEGDGEMTPRIKLTSVPYAFRAGAITDAAGNAFTGDDLAQIAPGSTQAVNAAIAALRLNQTGAGGLLQLQGDGADVFTVAKDGSTQIGSGLTLGDSTSTTAGTLRWTGTDFEGFNGATWDSLTSGGGGGAPAGPVSVSILQAIDSVGGLDVNQATIVAVPWNAEIKKDTGFTHDNVTNSTRVTLDDAGWYKISYSVAHETTSNARSNVRCQVRMNGSTVIQSSTSYTYTRQTGDPNASNSASTYIETTSANEYYEVVCSRDGSAAVVSTIAGQSWTIAEKAAEIGGASAFEDGGNSFGGTGVLGTTDTNGLQIITDSNIAIEISSTGDVDVTNDLTVGGALIAGGGIDITSGDLDLSGGDIIGVGSLTATDLSGDGSGLTDLNGDEITTGVINDARLSTNVALLDTAQSYTARPSFSAGLNVGNTADASAGNIRWSGADFEGYDGTDWVSLTSGGVTGSASGDYHSETINSNSNAAAGPYDVFETGNYAAFSSTTNATNGITYTPADGRFTIANDGVYNIEANYYLESSATALMNVIVRVNGTNVFNEDTFIHTAVDPVERSVSTIQDLTAGDFVEFLVQGPSGTITTHGGTTVTIVPVSAASGGGGGGGGGGTSFDQNGNSFGSGAILGTTDNNGLTIITNTAASLTLTSTGSATFANDVTISSGGLSVTSGGVDISAGSLVVGGGIDITSGNLDLSSGDIIGVNVLTAGTINGNGSGLTDLNGSQITAGIIPDGRLSSNIARLDTAQTFTGTQTFGSGAVLGNFISTTAGAIRWSGADFEGYDGTDWVSLTDSGADVINIVKGVDEIVNNSNTLQDDDELTFAVGANETWTFDFVLQARSATNPDYRFAVTAPAGSTCEVGYESVENAQSVSQYGCGVSTNRVNANNANDVYRVVGTVNTGPTAGNVTLQWAQFTANASDTTVFAGSYVRAISENAVVGGGGGGGGTAFEQGGNSFGATGIIGTTDSNGLRIVSGGSNALEFDSSSVGTFANGFSVSSGSIDLSSGGIVGAGSVTGATTISATGAISAATVGDTINGLIIDAGALSGVTTLSATGSITAATTGDTINGLVVDGGELSSVNGFTQDSGNFSISGAGTFSTGTGDIDLNGTVTTASTVDIGSGLSVAGSNANVTSIGYFESAITAGSIAGSVSPAHGPFTFDADDDADEAAWTFVSDNGTDGLNTANFARAWSHDTNETVSTGVGPTSGQGGAPDDGYVYTEASNPNAFNDTYHVTLNSTLDASASNFGVEFYWNQRGDDNTASLDLQTNENGAGWVTRGSYGGGDQPTGAVQAWNFESVDLTGIISGTSTQVRFLVTMPAAGTNWNNDFGLDTITINQIVLPSYGDNVLEAYNANTTSDVDLLTLRSDVGATGNVVFRVDSDGDVFSDGTNNISGGADIAEKYMNHDGAQAGDVVYFTDNRTVAKTTEEHQAGLAGVISTNAAIILDADVDGIPVGLKGRLPTKVSVANGTIRRGDYLTSGPDGRAVKAISSGTAIGVAMQQAETNGTIDVFVGLTYFVADSGYSIPSGGLTFEYGGSGNLEVNPEYSDGLDCSEEGCGYLKLAQENIINDDGAFATIHINNTGEGGGDFVRLERNGEQVFTITDAGEVQLQSTSQAALDVRDVGGISYFSVNTQTGVSTVSSLEIVGGITGAGLVDCDAEYDRLQWDSDSSLFSCKDATPTIRSFVDTSINALIDEDTTGYWDVSEENNNTTPFITPTSDQMSVYGSVTIEFISTPDVTETETDVATDAIVRVERSIGEELACGSGVQIGGRIGVSITSDGRRKSSTITFLDEPGTTENVYYTVCSDSLSSGIDGVVVGDIRVSMQEVLNSN